MATTHQPKPCPRCGNPSDTFVPVDANLRKGMQQAGENSIPDRICASCLEGLTGTVSQGLKLRMEQDTREKNKMMAWKNRVHLIKNARNLMNQKAYSEAAVQYEKYLRVLEVVYKLKKDELSPAVFNNSTRSKELTVIASVYWDLVRIYDTSPRYGDRMAKAAQKLSQFLQFSQIYPDIVKKAEIFLKTCKNPDIVRQAVKVSRGKGACFIATAAFAETPLAPELWVLRRYRDEVLRRHCLGRRMIAIYYRCSPPMAKWLEARPSRAKTARLFLTIITLRLKKSLNSTPTIGVLKR